MSRVLFRVAVALCIFFLFVFSVFMFNQFSGLAALAGSFYPQSHDYVLYGLSGLYLVFCITPILIFFLRPGPLRLPENPTTSQRRTFARRMKKRLRRNSILKEEGVKVRNEEDIKNALTVLDEKATDRTRRTASKIFLATAVSQNGKLDSLIVLGTLGKLVWDISKIYNQRSSASDMLALYSNVAATTFFAGAVEELDIQAQIDSVMSPVLASSALGMIPGASGMTSIVTTSILDGSANAFLALRIGIMTRNYFNYRLEKDSAKYRNQVMSEAARHLLGIAVESTRKITGVYIKTVTKAAGNKATSAAKTVFSSGAQAVKFSTDKAERISRAAKKENPQPETEEDLKGRHFFKRGAVGGLRDRLFNRKKQE